MKRIVLLVALCASFSSCHEKQVERVDPSPDLGKHQLDESDPRGWRDYPTLLLVATKYHLGVDTTAQTIIQFENRFNLHSSTNTHSIILPSYRSYNHYEEDTDPISEDVDFFVTQGQRLRMPAATVASMITDFYMLGGSNRKYPRNNQDY